MSATAAGDRAAFDAFVARHQGPVWRFTRMLTRRDDSAEDLFQETFLSAYRAAGTFRGEAGQGAISARPWLFTIARNAWRRQAKKAANEDEGRESLESLGAAAGWGSTQDEPDPLRRALLERALMKLPEPEREVLVLRELDQLSGPETADVLGITLAAMKTRLHRARLHLMALLQKENVDGA